MVDLVQFDVATSNCGIAGFLDLFRGGARDNCLAVLFGQLENTHNMLVGFCFKADRVSADVCTDVRENFRLIASA